MVDIIPPTNHHTLFVDWAKEQGVLIDGVWPAEIAGRGIGVVAQRNLKVSYLFAWYGRVWLIYFPGWRISCDCSKQCIIDNELYASRLSR